VSTHWQRERTRAAVLKEIIKAGGDLNRVLASKRDRTKTIAAIFALRDSGKIRLEDNGRRAVVITSEFELQSLAESNRAGETVAR